MVLAMSRLKTLKPSLQVVRDERVPTMQAGGWRTKGMTAAQRGYDYRWQKAREQYLAEHPLCVRCEAQGLVVAANVVDHVIAHRGDKRLFWDRTNWQALCTPCHSGDKQREERTYP